MRHSSQQGSILIELCVAIGLFSLGIGSIAAGIYYSDDNTHYIASYRQSLYQAQHSIEKARVYSQNSFSSIITSSTTTSEFNEYHYISDISPCKKLITTHLESTTGRRQDLVEMSAVVTNPHYTVAVGGDCDGSLITATNTLRHLFVSDTDTASTLIDVLKGVTYTVQNKATSSVFSIIDTSHAIRSQIELPSLTNTLDVIEDYAFIGLNASSSQVWVIHTSDPQSPQIIAKRSLPGVAGSYPGALSLSYYNKKLYVATHRTAGHEFHIFDASHPASLQWLGSREVNHNINHLSIRDSYAYMATSGNIKDIIILDISSPTSIQQISTVDIIGNEDAHSLFLIGERLYIGRSRSKTPSNPEFAVIRIQDPLNPQIVGSLYINESIQSITVSAEQAFVLTQSSTPKILTVDVSTSSPRLLTTEVLSQPIKYIDYEANTLYGI